MPTILTDNDEKKSRMVTEDAKPTAKGEERDLNICWELVLTVKAIIAAYLRAVYHFFFSPCKKSVEGEVVLVTGAGSGFGRLLACEFARLGARVVLWDVDGEANQKTASLIDTLGGTCFTYICDVSDREQVYKTGVRVQQEVGEVSILVNNAGVVSGMPLLDCPDHLIERTFHVNLLAHFWTVKCFLPSMLRRNHGHVVNMASSVGLVGINKLADYCASKFGVVGFSEVLNYEVVFSGKTGVHTTVVCPSYTRTGLFQGCEMRFPSVVPALEPQATVEVIMQGILTNKHQICIPRLVYFFAFLKSMLPVDAMVDVVRFFGADKFMDSYVGKGVVHAKQ